VITYCRGEKHNKLPTPVATVACSCDTQGIMTFRSHQWPCELELLFKKSCMGRENKALHMPNKDRPLLIVSEHNSWFFTTTSVGCTCSHSSHCSGKLLVLKYFVVFAVVTKREGCMVCTPLTRTVMSKMTPTLCITKFVAPSTSSIACSTSNL
jgi:hypothetical protein